LINFSATISSYKFIKVLRVFRPLKIISKNEGLKLAFLAMLHAIPNIISVAIVIAIFFITFSVCGNQVFKGMFFVCKDAIITEGLVNKFDCVNSGGIWRNPFSLWSGWPLLLDGKTSCTLLSQSQELT
jgi:hypothetical protein